VYTERHLVDPPHASPGERVVAAETLSGEGAGTDPRLAWGLVVSTGSTAGTNVDTMTVEQCIECVPCVASVLPFLPALDVSECVSARRRPETDDQSLMNIKRLAGATSAPACQCTFGALAR
jgi:hypothetical protein